MYTAINDLVLSNILNSDLSILDVGCGTGSNASEIKSKHPDCSITGINHCEKELALANQWLDQSIVFDLNSNDLLNITNKINGDSKYDLIICSHILEHLINPSERVKELTKLLKPNGRMILIVPNFAIWKSRVRLFFGKFDYEEHGLYDSTHLRFYTWHSFARDITPDGFVITKHLYSGSFPLPILRRILPSYLTKKIDNFFLKKLPNLFSSEIGLIIHKAQ